jgi:hypothetical protein
MKKGSEIAIEMTRIILKEPECPEMDAMTVGLLFFLEAWNAEVEQQKNVDLSSYEEGLRQFEAETPDLCSNFISPSKEQMINDIRLYKKIHYPQDQRLVLSAGINERGNVQVSWQK